MDYKGIAKSLLACSRLYDCENCMMPNDMGCQHELKEKASTAIMELVSKLEAAEKKLARYEQGMQEYDRATKYEEASK